MTERDDIDALAGEYVLGSLDASERRAVDARRAREPELERAIAAWERRLGGLVAEAAPVAPPPDLFRRIEAATARLPASGQGRDGQGIADAPARETADVIVLRRSLTRWRTLATCASALAAGLALFAVFRDQVLPPKPQTFVAAFVKNDDLPQFMLTVDLAARELTIRPVGADRLQGKTYQLWITSEQIGPPRSLGVLDDGSGGAQRKSLAAYDPAQLQTATFGVSVEQMGGSPTGRPSPGALHAKLVPAIP